MCYSVRCLRTDDGHAFAVRVEVEQRQHMVRILLIHLPDGDGVLGTRQEHVAEVPGGCHQSALVWRRCLVNQIAWEEDGTCHRLHLLSYVKWEDHSCTESWSERLCASMATVFVLHHDGVTEGEQFEELQRFLVLQGSDNCHQWMIHELEFFVS